MLATTNKPLTLALLSADGRTDLFGQARIYSNSGALVQTVNLDHIQEGLYQAQYTPTTGGYFQVVYQLYLDVGRTVDAGYEHHGEMLDVSSFKTDVARILGLVHENTVIDQQVYNLDGRVTGARIRTYDTAANAVTAGMTGLQFQYTVSAEFSGNLLTKYQILRDL